MTDPREPDDDLAEALLTGRSPVPGGWQAVGAALDTARTLADEPPPPPSLALTTLMAGKPTPPPRRVRFVAAVAALLSTSIVGAGMAGALPGSVQNVFGSVVEAVTPFHVPTVPPAAPVPPVPLRESGTPRQPAPPVLSTGTVAEHVTPTRAVPTTNRPSPTPNRDVRPTVTGSRVPPPRPSGKPPKPDHPTNSGSRPTARGGR